MALTLSAKEALLSNTVALPTCNDWQLLIDHTGTNELVVNKLNAALVAVLEKAKSNGYKTWGHMLNDMHKRILPIWKRYPHAGIYDSEGKQTMARFFVINYDTSMYQFIRFC